MDEEPLEPLLTDGNDDPDEPELDVELDDDPVELVEPVLPVDPVERVVDVVVLALPVDPVPALAATVAALEAWARAATPTVPAMLIAARPPVRVLALRRPVSRSFMDVLFGFMQMTIPDGPEGARPRR